MQSNKHLSQSQLSELIQFRRELHANPEISGEEKETSRRITEFLKNHGISYTRCGKYGVIATFNGSKEGETTLIRADSDGLPIQEVNQFEHRSTADGKSHKCGHDGHTTILLATALLLHQNEIKSGRVLLLWQPSEENGEGAEEMLSQPELESLELTRAVALHNLPGFPLSTVVTKSGPFTAAVKSLIIKLDGKTAHAAEPENGINPALGISKILQACIIRTRNVPENPHFFLITPVYVNMGDTAYGISAGQGEVHLTIRSWTNQVFEKETQELLQAIKAIGEEEKLKITTSWTQEFHANENHPAVVDQVIKAAKQLDLNLIQRSEPFKWGEDFGLFTDRYPGAMFGIGAGESTPALHNPDYDFPDELIETGSSLFYQLIANNH